MSKKKGGSAGKSDDGQHQAPRRTVALPLPWFKVAKQLADKGPTPVVWWLVKLIEKEAKEAGITDLPPPPWETDEK